MGLALALSPQPRAMGLAAMLHDAEMCSFISSSTPSVSSCLHLGSSTMIVVFVVDTSPSMAEKVGGGGMSKLDLAKMTVETLSKGLDQRVQAHNREFQQEKPTAQQSLHNLGLGYCSKDQFLLLSTGRQYAQQPALAACGAGGRLLVGFAGDYHGEAETAQDLHQQPSFSINHGEFERELKRLRATDWSPTPTATDVPPAASAVGGQKQLQQPKRRPFPEDGGGAIGLNSALSTGLQLLSRYRLKNRATENFGMGRLPSSTMLSASAAAAAGKGQQAGANKQKATATYALQPACLVLLTDGECLRKPPAEGGGNLQLQFGSAPLRDFYREPFRWDQRIFCVGVGSNASRSLHPSLQAFCEVTGGCYTSVQSSSALSQVSERLIQIIAPSLPQKMPIPNPLRHPSMAPPTSEEQAEGSMNVSGVFVNGGPVCSFQQLESGEASMHRALLLHVPSRTDTANEAQIYAAPIFCIPESFFPDKNLDTLPPRTGQPVLTFSRHPQHHVGTLNTFDPLEVMNLLHRLDQLVTSNKQLLADANASSQMQASLKLLSRDVYVCDWISKDGKRGGVAPKSQRGHEHFPVSVRGAGRPALSEDDNSNMLNIGILHLPHNRVALSDQSAGEFSSESGGALSSITLLPPEPHILLPLLVRAAELENMQLKKSVQSKEAAASSSAAAKGGSTAGFIKKQQQSSSTVTSRNVPLDEQWRSDFRAYLFRIPPYYQHALRRCLRPILPSSAQSLLSTDSYESIAAQCFSRSCLQKIRQGEKVARETNERLERQEAELRRRGVQLIETHNQDGRRLGLDAAAAPVIGYGQYDPRASVHSYLAALRNMPPPWRAGAAKAKKKCNDGNGDGDGDGDEIVKDAMKSVGRSTPPPATKSLGDLPAECLLAYYESRRRWIFGGSGLTTRGLSVEGVNNDGGNCHYYEANHSMDDESLISLCGVGASMLNKSKISDMGDYRERLLWSRKPVVGYGCNDSTGSAATTAPDGSPNWSVDDDALPTTFFDPKTGEFVDSVQTRVKTRLMINFGNPYKDRRGDSLIPENFSSQRPPLHHETPDVSPPGSPPHDGGYSSPVEGEGEAAFAGISRKSPHHADDRKHKLGGLPKLTPRSKRVKRASSTEILAGDGDLEGAVAFKTPSPSPSAQENSPSSPAAPPPSEAKKRPPPPSSSGEKKKPAPPSMADNQQEKRAPPPHPSLQKRPSDGKINAAQGAPLAPRPGLEKRLSDSEMAATATLSTPEPAAVDLQNPSAKPAINLPQGWMCVWSKSQKRWYFFDTKTNKSVWEWPPPGGL